MALRWKAEALSERLRMSVANTFIYVTETMGGFYSTIACPQANTTCNDLFRQSDKNCHDNSRNEFHARPERT